MSIVRPRRLLAASVLAGAATLLLVWSATAAVGDAAKPGTGVIVTLGSTDIGRVLIDARGRTLYLYTPDTKKTSTCYGRCATLWPPFLTSGKPRARHGVKASLLGTTTRRDGRLQVTYAGHPLYFFAQDGAPGDVNGQGLQGIWYALSAKGTRVSTAPPPATIEAADNSLGSIVTDGDGLTLYTFERDTGTTSTCYGQCAANWPPLLASGKLRAAAGLQSSLLGTTGRTDGTTQVTYAGHPLYHYVKDTKPGDTNGQGVLGIWFVLSPAGAAIRG